MSGLLSMGLHPMLVLRAVGAVDAYRVDVPGVVLLWSVFEGLELVATGVGREVGVTVKNWAKAIEPVYARASGRCLSCMGVRVAKSGGIREII
ncbi:MAG: hypothetical protein ABI209_05710 [Edaphobacter sp.]